MSSYRQIIYHIILRTKNGKNTLSENNLKQLFAYISGIVQNNKCTLDSINGTEDHIHFLSDLHPDVSLANYIKEIKTASSIWIRQNKIFPDFEGWADGYAALTCAWKDKELIINYIKNQQEQHKTETFETEYRRLLTEYGIEITDRYFL